MRFLRAPFCFVRFARHAPSRRAASLPASLADFPSRRLFATRTDFLPACDAVPVCHVLVRRRVRPCISSPVAVSSDSAHIASPSMPPARPDIASARPPRRMAPRGAGRESMTCQFGVDRHGSRWRPPDMPDAIHDARSRRSSGQRIPDTDIEAREAGGMRLCVETSASCDTECIGILRFQSKFHSMRFRLIRSGSYHILGMGMALPRVLESRSGHRPWRLGASLRIAGRRGGRGENRMSLEDTWHVAR